MRILSYIISLLFLAGCVQLGGPPVFTFYDSHGELYHSNTAGIKAKEEYRLTKEPKLILIATSSTNLAEFKEQMEIIYKVDPEESQYMYVVANGEKEDRSGYYTTRASAKKILSGVPFRVCIYDGNGSLIKSSTTVISEKDLRYNLIKNSGRR